MKNSLTARPTLLASYRRIAYLAALAMTVATALFRDPGRSVGMWGQKPGYALYAVAAYLVLRLAVPMLRITYGGDCAGLLRGCRSFQVHGLAGCVGSMACFPPVAGHNSFLHNCCAMVWPL